MFYIRKNYNTLIVINYINWNYDEEIFMPILKKSYQSVLRILRLFRTARSLSPDSPPA